MSEIQTYPIGKDEAEKASPFLSQEAENALLKGLPVTALAAVLDGNAIGALAGAIDGYVFEIWSIYVDPEHRRKGAGRALIDALEKLLEGSEGVMTTAAGMPIRARYTAVSKDNETLLPFFLGMGFNGDPIPHPMLGRKSWDHRGSISSGASRGEGHLEGEAGRKQCAGGGKKDLCGCRSLYCKGKGFDGSILR